MRFKIVLHFIIECLRTGTNPRMFFQIHVKFFNLKRGIFSKYEIEKKIPEKWRLKSYKVQIHDTAKNIAKTISFPIFGKPEWGQNAHGISYIQTNKDLSNFLKQAKKSEISYLLQKASKYKNEYEICFARNPRNLNELQIHSISESKNKRDIHINGIHSGTLYEEIIEKFDEKSKRKLISYIRQMGELQLGRVGLKANTIQDLRDGKFEVFEINIFIPLPLKLIAYNIDQNEKDRFLKEWIKTLVALTKNIQHGSYKEVFLRKILLHYKIKLIHNKYYMKLKRLIYKFIEDTFMNGCSDYNSLHVRRSCRSKLQAREMFEKHNIPHAKGLVFINPYSAYKFVKEHDFPVVLKPNVGGYSRGSHFPITNLKDFWKAMFFVKFWWPSSVVEQYLLGKNYRIVTTKDSVDIAMERTPAFIIGDGKKDINSLIDEENTIRKEMKLDPVIHLIEKSRRVKAHLQKHGFTLQSVPKKGEKVYMYHRVSLAPGGVLFTVDTDTITEKNKALFIKILDVFESNIFGIDVIMEKGIEVDFDKQKTIFLEVNSRPYMKMHEYPRCGNKPNTKPLYDKLDLLEVEGRGLY